jgi:hypothetical protein
MATFAEAYCTRTACPPDKFSQRIFWRTLHWHALPFAPFLLLGDYFESDRSLIAACGRASRMREVVDETWGFPYHPQNSSWLHRHANLRVSTRRLRDLAATYLTKAPLGAAPGAAVAQAE